MRKTGRRNRLGPESGLRLPHAQCPLDRQHTNFATKVYAQGVSSAAIRNLDEFLATSTDDAGPRRRVQAFDPDAGCTHLGGGAPNR